MVKYCDIFIMYISLYKMLKLKFDFIWNQGGELKNVIYVIVKFFLNIWYKLYYKDRNIFCKYVYIVLCKIYCY